MKSIIQVVFTNTYMDYSVSNGKEKKLGLAAKARLKELCIGNFKVKSLGKGKYGRILGIPYTEDGRDICQVLIKEGHAVEYDGGKKKKVWGDY